MTLRTNALVVIGIIALQATAAAQTRQPPVGPPPGVQAPRDPQRPSEIGLKAYPTRYYLLHTDLSEPEVREVALRMTKMAEEYHARTRGFAGQIRDRLDFFLYRRVEDYVASGGPPGTAGVFDRRSLRAVAGEKLDDRAWSTIQHEGFHQFAQHVIHDTNLPIWVNEGLAEYFGEAAFTGDGFVSGLMPPWRVARVKKHLEAGRFKPIAEMMALSHAQWNAEMDVVNYDQAWAMVQFLAHGDDGRYQQAFERFMSELGRGRVWSDAWTLAFGDARGFEDRFRAWWLAQGEHPTRDLYAHVTVAQLTGLLARAASQQQSFDDIDALLAAVEADQTRAHADDWLPASLNAAALRGVKRARAEGAVFSMGTGKSQQPTVVCRFEDGTTVTGSFTLRGTRVRAVEVTRADPAATQPTRPARRRAGER
jgi:hypothetical protein